MLYILSLACSKLSLVVFIRNLTPIAKDKRLALIVEAVIGVWTVVAIFGTAFQCSLPRAWDIWHGKCFNIVSSACLHASSSNAMHTDYANHHLADFYSWHGATSS